MSVREGTRRCPELTSLMLIYREILIGMVIGELLKSVMVRKYTWHTFLLARNSMEKGMYSFRFLS